MAMEAETQELVTPGQVLGKASQLKAGKGAYVSTENGTVYASLTGFRSLIPPPSDSVDQVLFLSESYCFAFCNVDRRVHGAV